MQIINRSSSPGEEEEEEEGRDMKIVTYNVNGLRQRVSQHGSLLKLLNSLDADIICFQETKLSRQDLSVDLTMAEGYEAFVSCVRRPSKGRSSYSGVATFCRVKSAFSSNEVALPIAAEDGFTGLLDCPKNSEEMPRNFLFEMPIKEEGLQDITSEDLLKVDSEGRCIITDHGHFVLFNLYGPRAVDDDKERIHFKLLFYKMLQKRWELLLSQGRRIIVVGDLNIAPASIDRCDAEPGFERNMFRRWLRSLLRGCGGPFFDVFRSKHPERKEAYTCFSARIGAEEFNYGSRIDHILIAGSCLHQSHLLGRDFLDCHVEECDIMIQFMRGKAEKASKWKGGRDTKLDGSDHVPVYAILSGLPDLPFHDTPTLAVRYIPEVRGWQQTIVSFLKKKEVSTCLEDHSISKFLTEDNSAAEDSNECGVSSQDYGTLPVVSSGASHRSVGQNFVSDAQYFDPVSKAHSGIIADDKKNVNYMLESEKDKYENHCNTTVKKKARHMSYSQLTLKSFFKQPNTQSADIECIHTAKPHTVLDTEIENEDIAFTIEQACDGTSMGNINVNSSETLEPHVDQHIEDQIDVNLHGASKKEKNNVALLEWQRIQQIMRTSLPLCKGHGEPCVARSVKRGPNIGRRFYVCGRAQGPESEPEANCGYFQWASVSSKQKRKS